MILVSFLSSFSLKRSNFLGKETEEEKQNNRIGNSDLGKRRQSHTHIPRKQQEQQQQQQQLTQRKEGRSSEGLMQQQLRQEERQRGMNE